MKINAFLFVPEFCLNIIHQTSTYKKKNLQNISNLYNHSLYSFPFLLKCDWLDN